MKISSPKKFVFLFSSLFLIVSLFLVFWFGNEIVDTFFFFAMFIFLILIIFYILVLVLILRSIFIYKNKIDIISLIILIIGFIFNLIFPFSDVKFDYDFKTKMNDRLEVINYVKNSDVSVSENGVINLPFKYYNLSSSGDIVVHKENNSLVIEFFIYRGFLSDGSKILVYLEGKESDIRENISYIKNIEKVDDNWYYVILE